MPLSPAAFGRSGVFVGHPHPVAAEESLGFLIFCLGSVAVLRGHLNVGKARLFPLKKTFRHFRLVVERPAYGQMISI